MKAVLLPPDIGGSVSVSSDQVFRGGGGSKAGAGADRAEEGAAADESLPDAPIGTTAAANVGAPTAHAIMRPQDSGFGSLWTGEGSAGDGAWPA